MKFSFVHDRFRRRICRSYHWRCSVKIAVLKNFAKFTGKHLCQSLFFNKVAGLSLQLYEKKRLWHKCFPVNFTKCLKTPFLENNSGLLLMNLSLNLALIMIRISKSFFYYSIIWRVFH